MERTSETEDVYEERHWNRTGIALALLAVACLLPILVGESPLIAAIFLLPLVFVLLPTRMTLRLDGTSLRARYRFGAGREMRLADVAEVGLVRSSWLRGWGLVRLRDGWRVGTEARYAVELTDRLGQRLRVSSQRPDALLDELRRRLGPRVRQVPEREERLDPSELHDGVSGRVGILAIVALFALGLAWLLFL